MPHLSALHPPFASTRHFELRRSGATDGSERLAPDLTSETVGAALNVFQISPKALIFRKRFSLGTNEVTTLPSPADWSQLERWSVDPRRLCKTSLFN